jgi:hypothetical protein
MNFPLESIQGELAVDAILKARSIVSSIAPLVSASPLEAVGPNSDSAFRVMMMMLDEQVLALREEAGRLIKGQVPRHAAAAK